MTPLSTTVAFIGATGGCANAALVLALQAGYSCTALARTPTKLSDKLLEAGVTQETLETKLRITKGDIRNPQALRAVLKSDGAATTVDLIVSGIGMVLGKDVDKDICRDAQRCVLAALDALNPLTRPFVVNISSAGVTLGHRDTPIAYLPLYHTLLKIPRADKRAMEAEVIEARKQGEIAGFVIVRPSLLTDGVERGMAEIRVGSEESPAVGWTISRKDVGRWIFEELIRGEAGKWDGKKPSITY